MTRSLALPLILLMLSLACSNAAQWIFFDTTLNTLEVRSARQVAGALAPVLEHAHRLNDDLMLQESIQGLTQAPGLLFGGVLDNTHKVIAHTHPAQLGRTFDRAVRGSSKQFLWVHALRDATGPWGSLVFSDSKRTRHQMTLQQAWLLCTGDVLAVFSAFWWVKRWNLQRALDKEKAETLIFRCEELSQQVLRLSKNQERSDALWTSRMQTALEQIPQRLLLLDPTQRLLACNRTACQSMGIASADVLRGRSWQEVPILAGCGETLQRSLERPGERIETTSNDVQLQFLSDLTNGSTTTWVYWV